MASHGNVSLQNASVEQRNDRGFVMEAINKCVDAYQYASEELKRDRNIALFAVKKCAFVTHWLSPELCDDHEIMLAAVNENGITLINASDRLKNDREIALTAVKQTTQAMAHVSLELKNDIEFLLSNESPFKLTSFFSDEVRSNSKFRIRFREIFMKAVQEDGINLSYGLNDHLNDIEIVLTAVKNNGYAITYASNNIKDHHEIVYAALSQNSLSLQCMSDLIKDTHEMVLFAVRSNGKALSFASQRLRNNFDIVITAVANDGLSLCDASNDMRNHRRIVLTAIYQTPDAIKYATKTFHEENLDVVLKAAVLSYSRILKLRILDKMALKMFIIDYLEKYNMSLDVFYSTFLFGCSCIKYQKMRKKEKEDYLLLLSPYFGLNGPISESCLLRLNELGKYGCLNFKRQLADYAGVQVGDPSWWCGVHQVLAHLQ